MCWNNSFFLSIFNRNTSRAPNLQCVDVPHKCARTSKRLFVEQNNNKSLLFPNIYVNKVSFCGVFPTLYCCLGLFLFFYIHICASFGVLNELQLQMAEGCVTFLHQKQTQFKKQTKKHSSFTCIVNTPSSWEDSFFICSAKTCASSRMENSVSAAQYPQESAEQINTKLQEKAPEKRRCLCRKAARVLGVKGRRSSPVRRAMMAGEGGKLQEKEEHGVWAAGGGGGGGEEKEKKKLQGKLLLQLCSVVECVRPFSPQACRFPGSANHRSSFRSLRRPCVIHA